jgi:hypothetical protein
MRFSMGALHDVRTFDVTIASGSAAKRDDRHLGVVRAAVPSSD